MPTDLQADIKWADEWMQEDEWFLGDKTIHTLADAARLVANASKLAGGGDQWIVDWKGKLIHPTDLPDGRYLVIPITEEDIPHALQDALDTPIKDFPISRQQAKALATIRNAARLVADLPWSEMKEAYLTTPEVAMFMDRSGLTDTMLAALGDIPIAAALTPGPTEEARKET